MIVNRRIILRTIVTEQFKEKVIQELQEAIKQLDAEINYLEQRGKRTVTELTLKASPQAQALKEQFEWEKRKREESKAGLMEQMKKAGNLELGTEVLQGEITGPVELQIGDRWDKINNTEIVLKDGSVVDIR